MTIFAQWKFRLSDLGPIVAGLPLFQLDSCRSSLHPLRFHHDADLKRIAYKHNRAYFNVAQANVAGSVFGTDNQSVNHRPLAAGLLGNLARIFSAVRLAIGNHQHSCQRLSAVGGQRLVDGVADRGAGASRLQFGQRVFGFHQMGFPIESIDGDLPTFLQVAPELS